MHEQTNWDNLFNRLTNIEYEMATHADIKRIENTLESHTKSLDGITKDLKHVKQDLTSNNKRLARVKYRTEKLLGKKLTKTDAGFEAQYSGEKPVVASPAP